MANATRSAEADPTLRIIWLVAKCSADLQLEQAAEAALQIGATSVVLRLGQAREALKHQQLPGAPLSPTVALGNELVRSHVIVRNLKKECASFGVRNVVLKNIKWAAIAMHEAVACCVVCEHHFPDEQTYIAALNLAYGFSPEEKEDDLRSQVIKAYHHVFGGTSTKAFSSKASRDTARRGRVRPRRPKKDEEDLALMIGSDAGGDDEAVEETLQETMTVAMIPPEMGSALLGEPRMIAEDVIREMLSRDVACSSSSVSSLVLSRTQAWLYDPGELLLSESRYDPLVAIQSARLISGKGIAIVTDGGIQRLEDVHPEQPLRGDNSLFFGLKNAEGSSTSLSFNLPAGAMCHRDFNSEGPWLGGALGSFTEGGSLPYQPKDDERKESCGSFSASSHDEEYQRKDLLHGRLSVDIAILDPVGTGAAGSAPRIARMFSS